MAKPNEMKNRWPLLKTDDLVGAIYHPTDGYINPADVTQSMAKGARLLGVDIHRKIQVNKFEWTGEEWDLKCVSMVEKGEIESRIFRLKAEHVITATGNHAQRTARLLGIKNTAIPVEHQYCN